MLFSAKVAYDNAKPNRIKLNEWYNLRLLAEIFDCQPGTLRKAIGDKELKARKRSRTWVVLGKDALEWWDEE